MNEVAEGQERPFHNLSLFSGLIEMSVSVKVLSEWLHVDRNDVRVTIGIQGMKESILDDFLEDCWS